MDEYLWPLHSVSLEWMKARKNYLTASDFYKLWPKTKTGRDRCVSDLEYLKLFVDKGEPLRTNDCISAGWAARGHIMEPYAVDSFNDTCTAPVLFRHWDDAIVADGCRGVGYSPDALNLVQPIGLVEVPADTIQPTALCEVKSYKASKHVEVAMAEKKHTEERIQIAVAMYVSSTIKNGYLVLFNPEVPALPLAWKHWHRDDLCEELEIVDEIAQRWMGFDVESVLYKCRKDASESKWTMDAIIEDYNKNTDATIMERMNDLGSGDQLS